MMWRSYNGGMRTTIDIPDDLHAQAVALARDTHQSLSKTVAGLIRRGLSSGNPGEIARSPRTGLPVAHLGKIITSEDVRRLEDDDQ
jgi:Arc/MetJ family transcription regulator